MVGVVVIVVALLVVMVVAGGLGGGGVVGVNSDSGDIGEGINSCALGFI